MPLTHALARASRIDVSGGVAGAPRRTVGDCRAFLIAVGVQFKAVRARPAGGCAVEPRGAAFTLLAVPLVRT